MADNYNPATARDAYYPSNARDLARLWSREKTLHDWSDMGIVSFFEGDGDDPTGLSGYATSKLWLRASAGVTSAPGTVRYYAGGDPTLLASWPVLTRAGFAAHLGGRGASMDYLWSSATSGDPGTGKVLANNATLASASALNISKTGRSGVSYAARIASWDDSTNTSNRGFLVIYAVAGSAEVVAKVTGAVSDNSTYYTVPVSVVSAATMTAGDLVGIDFSPAGDLNSSSTPLDVTTWGTLTNAT